jgi:hypothetical protein
METPGASAAARPADVGGAAVCDNQVGSANRVVCDDQVVRDDQADFPSLRDAAKSRRGSGDPLKLIDSGKLSVPELEWLGAAGAEIFTSDCAGRNAHDLALVSNAAGKGGARVAHFHHGPFLTKEGESPVPFADLLELGRSGLLLYASNVKAARDFAALDALSNACAKGGTRFGYYHHGALVAALEDLARSGAWVHIDGRSLAADADVALLADCARAARAAGAGVVLHVDALLDPASIADLIEAGCHILFLTPPSDYRSPYRPLEERARRLRLDPRASYLFPAFML